MTVKFLHTADWQLGKPFAGIADPAKRARVQQARIDVLKRIAAAVRAEGAAFIVVTGDLFDSPSVEKAVVSASCAAIGRMGVPVYVIPGNHDHGGEGSIWAQAFFRHEQEKLAPNLHVLREAAPVQAAGAVLLPCPLLRRHEAGDPTAWLRSREPIGDGPQIVLAHGSVHGFGGEIDEEESVASAANQIDLTRLPAWVDYVALGDWHGMKQVSPKAWYSGTPEQDRFSKGEGNEPGHVLVVTVERGAAPEVRAVRTTQLGWSELDFDFAGDDALAVFTQKMEALLGNRAGEDLLRLDLAGALGIEATAALEKALEAWEARLLRLKLTSRVVVAPSPHEIEALTQRAEDPLISRVAARLVALAEGTGEEAEEARLALRRLHAACTAI